MCLLTTICLLSNMVFKFAFVMTRPPIASEAFSPGESEIVKLVNSHYLEFLCISAVNMSQNEHPPMIVLTLGV